jgi:hypothetical protein
MYADLVVDVSGRGTKIFHWLGELGYETAGTTEVKVNVGYSTRIYERDASDPRGKKWIFKTLEAPKEYKGVGAFPIDNNRWIASIAGWHAHSIAATEEDFESTIKEVPIGDVYDIIKTCRPLSDLVHYKYASSLRRHYEKLRRFPETKGPRPAGIKLLNFYVSKVHRATLKDKTVCEAFLRVMSLLQPPSTLFHPKIVWRVFTA